MKKSPTFKESVNWEWVHAHNPIDLGKVKQGEWHARIITHAIRNGYKGNITSRCSPRIINSNLY